MYCTAQNNEQAYLNRHCHFLGSLFSLFSVPFATVTSSHEAANRSFGVADKTKGSLVGEEATLVSSACHSRVSHCSTHFAAQPVLPASFCAFPPRVTATRAAMDLDDASSSDTETEHPPYSSNPLQRQSPSSNDDEDTVRHSNSSADEDPLDPPHHLHLGHQHRVHSSHRLSRHHTKPLGGRTTSFNKNLYKLAAQSHLHDAAPAQAATSTQHSKPPYRRVVSSSLTSPTSTSPRPTQAFRRNASAFAMSRAATHSALKKNHSSGHLPRHVPGKGAAKAGTTRPAALPMKRTHSNKGQKSPKEPTHDAQHPTVRFDLGSEVAPGDGDEDNEWTEDSTSISPVTTRDHTRQNSVILDSNALRIGLVSDVPRVESSPLAMSSRIQDSSGSGSEAPSRNGPINMHRSSSTHSIPTADAITSRLLMRAPTQNTTMSTATTASSFVGNNAAITPNNYSNSDNYNGPDNNSAGSGVGSAESRLVGRFINGSSSQGTPLELRGETFTNSRAMDTPSDSPSIGKGKERAVVSKSLDSHRRNKSLSNVAAVKSLSRTHAPPSNLPPSRTQQKLELQRASSVLESTKHVIPILPRPSAPLILRSGLNIGFGFAEGDHFSTQTQSLFSQIGKEYTVVRRYRQPIGDALARIEPHITSPSAKRKGKGRSFTEPLSRTDADHAHRSRHRTMDDVDSLHSPSHVPDFHYPKPTGPRNTAARQQQQQQHLDPDDVDSSPEKSGKSRKSRVSFEIPPKSIATSEDADDDDDDGEQENDGGGKMRKDAESEVLEICRRMWNLNSIAGGTLG
jgi:hypothetical protein